MVTKNVVEMGPAGQTSPMKTAPKGGPKPVTPKPQGDDHLMRKLKIAKVTVNIGVGQAGDRLEKAERVLAALTNRKPVRTVAKDSHRDWAVRQGQPIGVKVTLRGPEAVDFTKRALETRNNKVQNWSVDREGNLNFGVPDHTAFEGQKYNPEIGVFGMDVCVTVERPGFRVKRRQLMPRSLPKDHRVNREASIEFLKQTLGVEIVG